MTTVYMKPFRPLPGADKKQEQHSCALKLLSLALEELYLLHYTPSDLGAQWETGEHGKPYLKNHPNIHFNISHCSTLIAVGISNAPIGIDAETVRPLKNPEAVAKRVLTEEELRYLQKYSPEDAEYQLLFTGLWTLKESLIKYTGSGFSVPPKTYSFTLDFTSAPPTATCKNQDMHFYFQSVSPSCILAVCTKDREIPQLVLVP